MLYVLYGQDMKSIMHLIYQTADIEILVVQEKISESQTKAGNQKKLKIWKFKNFNSKFKMA